ncbi:hypothetical protein CNMCM6069_001248 [Aspergillus lentulus]|nr:hypothetical protein CNMCM6069_001248 [Aspergillus lentulus]
MITWLKNLLSGDSAEARKKRKKEERAARERRKRIRERERELMRRRGIGTWKSSFFLAAPAPIVKLTSKFAALDETGAGHVWSTKSTVHAPYPPDENEAFKEVWDRYVLFGDPIRRWPLQLPEALDSTPKSLPLPPIQKMATGGCYNVGISHARQLCIWGYKSENWPEIADVNPMSAVEFKAAVIETDTGRRLQIVVAAAGRAHVVALAADGSLWSAGDGLNGQLGIGTRQFGLCTE